MRYTYKDENGNYQLNDDYASEKGIDTNRLEDLIDYIGEKEDLEEEQCNIPIGMTGDKKLFSEIISKKAQEMTNGFNNFLENNGGSAKFSNFDERINSEYKMEIKVNLKELIETIVDITVEHYVDECEDSMRYSHKQIVDENIDNMKNDLINKLNSIFEEKSE